MKKYCVQVSPQTSQPCSRARAIGSTASLHETWTTYSGAPATRASWIARFVASPSVSGGRVSAWKCGAVLPGGERLLHEDVDRVAVLGVHHHERAGLGGDLHRAEERLVVDHERALVGHEELVRGDALLRQARELLERPALAQVGHRDVEAHVDDLLPLALAVPGVERLGERAAGRLDAEVDVARRPTERRRRLPRGDVVDRGRAAERHVEMRVRVDAARQDVLARRVDDAIRVDVERLAEHRDALAVDVDVADVVVGGRDDPPALDQCRHVISPPSAGRAPDRTVKNRPGAHASSLLAALLEDHDLLLEALAGHVEPLLA